MPQHSTDANEGLSTPLPTKKNSTGAPCESPVSIGKAAASAGLVRTSVRMLSCRCSLRLAPRKRAATAVAGAGTRSH